VVVYCYLLLKVFLLQSTLSISSEVVSYSWNRQKAEVIQNHENEHVRGIGQGEANHRKYKRLKLGGGQAYDRSSV
jgi:hypothetical protein